MNKGSNSLRRFPVHLGLGAQAVPQPEFTGDMAWYPDYAARTAVDGAEGRIVSQSDFTANWTSWEVHPHGDELVICLTGAITVLQERPNGSVNAIALGPGEYAINPAGVWHTADIDAFASALFVTAGLGTSHRPR